MSYSISNLGNEMLYNWNKPIWDANFQNTLSYQKSLERMQVNGEISAHNFGKVKVNDIYLKEITQDQMGYDNNTGRARDILLYKPQIGVINNSRSLDQQMNPHKYNPITNQLIDYSDKKVDIYKNFWANLQANQGMSDPVQDPTSNYPSKRHLKY